MSNLIKPEQNEPSSAKANLASLFQHPIAGGISLISNLISIGVYLYANLPEWLGYILLGMIIVLSAYFLLFLILNMRNRANTNVDSLSVFSGDIIEPKAFHKKLPDTPEIRQYKIEGFRDLIKNYPVGRVSLKEAFLHGDPYAEKVENFLRIYYTAADIGHFRDKGLEALEEFLVELLKDKNN